MADVGLATGRHQLGPADGSLQVKTYREGVAAKAGHDLVMDVTRWEATVDVAGESADSTIEFTADSRSLEVREGVGGMKPLTDQDRGDIVKNIDEKILRGEPIAFRSSAVRVGDGDGSLDIEGDLTIGGATHSVSSHLEVGADGRVSGTIPLTQSEFGIKPYRGLMGALKVADELEIVIDARLPAE